MSDNAKIDPLIAEVVDLARHVCEGTISGEQRERLEELLADRQHIRRAYLDYLSVHAGLAWRYRVQAEAGEEPLAPKPGIRGLPSGWRSMRSLSLFAATLAALALVAVWSQGVIGLDDPVAESDRTSAYVATLASATQAVWTEGGEAVDVGTRVSPGSVRFSGGESELMFDSGARLLVSGAAEVDIESSFSLYLRRGKVAAHMPPAAKGFEVKTPMSKLVDMGTEFGVQVDDAGVTEVLVFRGRVDVYYAGEGPTGQESKLAVSTREARKIDEPGTAGVAIDFTLNEFEDLARRVAEPIEWERSEGGNGHYYQLVVNSEPLTWHEAARIAMRRHHRGMPGHLVTVTSRAEDEFVVQNLIEDVTARGVWIGLTDVLREGHFRWVTGEPYEYTNWADWPNQQPDNFREAEWHGGEDYGMYTKLQENQPWAWNDLSIDSMHEKISAFVIEYEPPIDALRHRSMSLDPIHWAKENGGNGHYYRMVLVEDPTDWETIRTRAAETELLGVPGQLASLESRRERQYVADEILRICGISQLMIGLSGSLSQEDLRWVNEKSARGLEVERSHLPTDEVYGVFHWNPAGSSETGWEVRAIAKGVRPSGWFGYLIEYPVGSVENVPAMGD